MSHVLARLPFHYACVVVVVTFLTLLVAAGVRFAPGVLIKPLEDDLGWDRASISMAVAVGILTFGLAAPAAGSLIDRFGPRRVMLGGLGLTALGLGPMLAMSELWQFHLFWGVMTGFGGGAVSAALGATVAASWFKTNRGMVVGIFSAATSVGQLVFLPLLIGAVLAGGWRLAVLVMGVVATAILVPIGLLMRDRPADVGLRAVGDDGSPPSVAEQAAEAKRTTLAEAIRTRDFWLLAGSFFVCGYTTNGLIGTHLIPHAVEHGFTEAVAASTVALMGSMNIVGTLASGWLTDRFDNRRLLATYYGLRALSIAALPFILEVPTLLLFAVVYGLDWIATVPPTVNLTVARFGRASLGTLYGWIFFAHMVGASLAAYAAGFFRQALGDYHLVFLSAALMGFVAVALTLSIGPSGLSRPAHRPTPAPAASR